VWVGGYTDTVSVSLPAQQKQRTNLLLKFFRVETKLFVLCALELQLGLRRIRGWATKKWVCVCWGVGGRESASA